jgi:deoxyribodipyrimidine photo-lyase
VATAEVAAKVDEDPPLNQLTRLPDEEKNPVDKGESVVYWMRMEDMRSE